MSGAVDAQFSAIVKEAEDLAAAATVRLKELELELLAVQAEKVHHIHGPFCPVSTKQSPFRFGPHSIC